MMSKLSHSQVLDELVRRLSKHYEITARNVLYGPHEQTRGEVDLMAFRHTPQGITLNLYEVKTNHVQYRHACEQLQRAKNYFSSVNTLPDYFKGVVLTWMNPLGKNMRINLIYVNPVEGVKRVGKYRYSGLAYVAEQGRKGREKDLNESDGKSDAAKMMQNHA
jgi:hypothetical protein